jgi:hypothetical protein
MVAGSGQLNFTRKGLKKPENVLNNAWEIKIFAAGSKLRVLG